MKGLDDLLSGGASVADSRYGDALKRLENELRGDFGQGIGGLDPYAKAGAGALPKEENFLEGLKDQMGGNWMKDYSESPYAKYLTKQETEAMNNAAAGGGLLGSGANITDNAQLASDIASKDMEQYFKNQMAQNRQYLGGLGDLISDGQGAADNIANLLARMGEDMGGAIAGEGGASGAAHEAGMSGKNSLFGKLFGGGDNSDSTDSGGKDSLFGGLMKGA